MTRGGWVVAGLLAQAACLPDYRFDLVADAGTDGGPPAPWWDTSFSRRIRLTVDTAVVAEDLVDVPVLVVPTPARIDYTATAAGGRDLRFVAGDGFTILPHEIDRWNPTGASHVWVKLPTLSPPPSTTTTFWMYFGNAGAPDIADAPEVWSEYVAVYHFSDDVAGGSTIRDVTNGNDGTAQQITAANAVPGLIGQAFDFVGGPGGPRVVVADTPAEDFDVPSFNTRVLEAWARRNDNVLSGGGIAGKEACCLGWGLEILVDDPSNVRSVFASGPCCAPMGGCCANPAYAYILEALPQQSADNDWHMFTSVMSRNLGRMVLYIDGIPAMEEFVPIPAEGTPAAAPFYMGADALGEVSFPGQIDEIRIGAHDFPSSWALVQTRSGSDELLTYTAMEAVPQ